MAFKEGNCEQCGKPEPSGLATCEGCGDKICNTCAFPEYDVPGHGNSGIFRCAECHTDWEYQESAGGASNGH